MHEQNFDEIFRHKLNEWDAAGGPEGWADLSLALESAGFDEQIRKKLEHASVNEDPNAWAAMESLLPHPFDAHMAQKLLAAEVALAPGDWEEMSQMLDAPFDASVREKLEGSFAPYRARDWRRMRAMLRRVQPQPFMNWRLAGAAAVLLLLGSALIWRLLLPVESAGIARFAPIDLGYADIQTPATLQPGAAEETSEKTYTHIAPRASARPAGPAIPVARVASSAPALAPTPAAPFAQEFLKDESSETAHDAALSQQMPETLPAARSGYALKALKPASAGALIFPSPAIPAQVSSLRGREAFKPVFAAGAYAARFGSNAGLSDTLRSGYAVGLRFQMRFTPRLSMVSGLMLAQKQYHRILYHYAENMALRASPVQPAVWQSKFTASISAIELPLMLRYDFNPGNRFNLYVQGGLAALITLEEHYYHYDPWSAANLSRSAASPENLPFSQLDAEHTQLHHETYGGHLQFAPGFSFQIGKHVGLEIEPYLQLGLQRTGTERQRINSAGVASALMYRF